MDKIELTYDRQTAGTPRLSLPSSKSMAARAIVIAALAGVATDRIGNLPDCTDTRELSAAVRTLLNAAPPISLHLNLGLGGTSLRFFTALAVTMPHSEILIDCAAPLKKRPLAPLCEALRDAGADITYTEKEGYPPLLVRSEGMKGGKVDIPGDISSQFISAMIMCAPYWRNTLTLHLTGDHAVSFPYIDMTAEMMRRAGAEVEIEERTIKVASAKYSAEKITAEIPGIPGTTVLSPEADWSAASYLYERSLLMPDRTVNISRLTPPSESLQGDSECARIFSLFGVETTFHPDGSASLLCDKATRESMAKISSTTPLELNMARTPDLVPAIAVGLCMAGIRFVISGVDHLRHKECDRLDALSRELRKIGFTLEAGDDTISWKGEHFPAAGNESIATYGDHRMAMSFAIAAAALPHITIENPQVTEKSFPGFFDIIQEAGFSIR